MAILSNTYPITSFDEVELDFQSIIDINSNEFVCPLDNYIKHISQLNSAYIGNHHIKIKLDELLAQKKIRKSIYDTIINEFNNTENLNGTLLNLVLLGHVSAVESYLREIVTKTVNIDPDSNEKCGSKTVSFMAVKLYPENQLVESILENHTFIEKKDILKLIEDYLGLTIKDEKGLTNEDKKLDQLLNEFEKICNLRHVIIHRFSKIGLKNIKKIELDNPKTSLEKKVVINYNFIQNAASTCYKLVILLNQIIADKVITRRYLINQNDATKKEEAISLKKSFNNYFKVFYSKEVQYDINEEFNKINTKRNEKK